MQRTVRLFPLGGLVFFPHGRLPLRIFEPRYKQMTEDALKDDREIVMILPKDDPAGDEPELHSCGTLGKIRHDRRLPNGEFLMELVGLSRVQIVRELETEKLYRTALVEVVDSSFESRWSTRRELQRAELLRHLHVILPERNQAVDEYLEFLTRQCGPSAFSDVVSYSSPIPLDLKQELLEEPNVDDRLDLLVETAHNALEGLVPNRRLVFPPEFSVS